VTPSSSTCTLLLSRSARFVRSCLLALSLLRAANSFAGFDRGVMVHARSFEKTEREMAAAALVESEIVVEVTPIGGGSEVLAASDGEGWISSGGESDDSSVKVPPTMRTHRRTVLGLQRLPLVALKKCLTKGILRKGKRELLGKK
jgi:hypothetical protein